MWMSIVVVSVLSLVVLALYLKTVRDIQAEEKEEAMARTERFRQNITSREWAGA